MDRSRKLLIIFCLFCVGLSLLILLLGKKPQEDTVPESSHELSADERARAYYIRLSTLAENGDAESQRELAARYILGEELNQDIEKGMKWLSKAAEQGSPQAQYELAMIYYEGEAIPQDITLAESWMKKSADQGFINAQRELATWYIEMKDAEGNPRDHDAFIYMEKAAIRGDADAQYILGEMYESGHGVPADLQKAREWWEQAKELGHQRAFQRYQRMTD